MNTPRLIHSTEGDLAMPALRSLAQAQFERRMALLQQAFDLADQPRRVALLAAQERAHAA